MDIWHHGQQHDPCCAVQSVAQREFVTLWTAHALACRPRIVGASVADSQVLYQFLISVSLTASTDFHLLFLQASVSKEAPAYPLFQSLIAPLPPLLPLPLCCRNRLNSKRPTPSTLFLLPPYYVLLSLSLSLSHTTLSLFLLSCLFLIRIITASLVLFGFFLLFWVTRHISPSARPISPPPRIGIPLQQRFTLVTSLTLPYTRIKPTLLGQKIALSKPSVKLQLTVASILLRTPSFFCAATPSQTTLGRAYAPAQPSHEALAVLRFQSLFQYLVHPYCHYRKPTGLALLVGLVEKSQTNAP